MCPPSYTLTQMTFDPDTLNPAPRSVWWFPGGGAFSYERGAPVPGHGVAARLLILYKKIIELKPFWQ